MLNVSFGINIKKGCFRFISFRIDYLPNKERDSEKTTLIHVEAEKILRCYLEKQCYDVFISRSYLLSRVFVNYRKEDDAVFITALEKALAEIEKTPGIAKNMAVTLAVSLPFENIHEASQGLREAMEALWLRYTKGTGKIIVWENEKEPKPHYMKILEKYKNNLKHACNSLDLSAFRENIKAFLSEPRKILGHSETRLLMYEVETYIYSTNKDVIVKFSGVSTIHQEVINSLREVCSLEEYINVYAEHMVSLLGKISSLVSKNERVIRRAQYFVEMNIDKPFTLTEVASSLNLNSVYFSHVYKKTTGKNFTDYVNNYRIASARQLLKQTDLKIIDVAVSTGFYDEKYFSKTFKKIEGITPTEYRKLHNGTN
jgi:two-component system response regulator YesN